MRSLGIDQATNATGMIVLDCDGGSKATLVAQYLFKTKAKMTAFEKQNFMMEKLEKVHAEHAPDITVLEGYGMNLKNPSAIIPLVELGGLLKFMLRARDIRFLDPAPAKWKQFLLGPKKGAAKKEEVAAFIAENFGLTFGADDVSDAYALAYMGLGYKGAIALTPWQREKLGEVSLQ